jgi:putative Holliday junction resolvase
MAFDFGLKRIGVAISNVNLKIPHPLGVIIGKNNAEKMTKITKLIDIWKPTELVVGMPRVFNDKLELINNINKFINRLKNNFKLNVVVVNEDYTSLDASKLLNEQKVYGINQKNKLDSISASLILVTYFDKQVIEEYDLQ